MKQSGLETMPRVLIIACGNPLRCDDGLAWRAVEDLHRRGMPEDVEIIAQHQLTPELASAVSQVERVLFLDAASQGQAGELRCELVLPLHSSGAFTHNFSPASILSLSQELYGKSPQAYVISLSGECFEYGEGTSATVEAALSSLVELVVRLTKEPLRASGFGKRGESSQHAHSNQHPCNQHASVTALEQNLAEREEDRPQTEHRTRSATPALSRRAD